MSLRNKPFRWSRAKRGKSKRRETWKRNACRKTPDLICAQLPNRSVLPESSHGNSRPLPAVVKVDYWIKQKVLKATGYSSMIAKPVDNVNRQGIK